MMSIRLDEASAAISAGTKAQRSSACDKSGTEKIHVGLFATLQEEVSNEICCKLPAQRPRIVPVC